MNAPSAPVVRDARPEDEAAWRLLWAGYLAFYEVAVPDDVTAQTWTRILDPRSAIFCRVAEMDGEVAGFAVSVVHEGTWAATPVCYLEDLYVAREHRGRGIGGALIEDLIAMGKAKGWSKLYWHTRQSNTVARRLYDTFVRADDFVRYAVDLREG